MWPGEYPPEGPRKTCCRCSRQPSLQCGRGSIPRKVDGGICLLCSDDSASMWPGEYPPEGPRGRGRPVEGSRCASMWPGEYPPEGPRAAVDSHTRRHRFNVAGGVSPGRSPRSPIGRSAASRRLQCGRGSIPRKVVDGREHRRGSRSLASMWPGEYPPEGRPMLPDLERLFAASMWPGEYPPEGLYHLRPVLPAFRASMWPGEYPPEGRDSPAAPPLPDAVRGFNVAGGVSPGRSWRPRPRQRLAPGASMWPGEYPPEGLCRAVRRDCARRLQCGRGSIPRKVGDRATVQKRGEVRASMWPGEYPPEGRQACYGLRFGFEASMWPGEYPPEGLGVIARRDFGSTLLQCGRGSIPRKVAAGTARRRAFRPIASMWPGEYPPEGHGEARKVKARFPKLLQCGRGSIPRKVGQAWDVAIIDHTLQCGRGSIPRKVSAGRWLGSPTTGFNVAGGVSPGRSAREPVKSSGSRVASMWPGEYPPEGRGSVSAQIRGGSRLQCGRGSIPRKVALKLASGLKPGEVASMWPGEYPPEGPGKAGNGGAESSESFNVAGGVSPGRSAAAPFRRGA